MTDTDMLGVVLAGGESRRMGRDKARLPWTGATLVERAAGVLIEVCGEVVVSGPPELAGGGLETVADRFPGRGPLAGLQAGLERAAGRGIFALACDMPFVDAALVRHLVAIGGGRPEGAWAAAGEDGLQPLCGVYAPGCAGVAASRLRAGKLAVLGFFEAVGGRPVPITPQLAFYRPELLLNLNRPEELARARRLQAATSETSR